MFSIANGSCNFTTGFHGLFLKIVGELSAASVYLTEVGQATRVRKE